MSLTTLAVSLFLASSPVTQSSAGPTLPLTVAPPSVFFGVRVPVRAFCNKHRSSLSIDFRRHSFKMLWIYAHLVATQMVELHPLGDRANYLLPIPTMCIWRTAVSDSERWVTHATTPLPHPARTSSSSFLHKIHESLHRRAGSTSTLVLTPIMHAAESGRSNLLLASFAFTKASLFRLAFEPIVRVAQVAVLAPRMVCTPALFTRSCHIWHTPSISVVGGAL